MTHTTRQNASEEEIEGGLRLLAESTPEAEAIAEAEREAQREAQLASLLAQGFDAHEAAPYCDGVTPVEQLVELIVEGGAPPPRQVAGGGGGGGSSACTLL